MKKLLSIAGILFFFLLLFYDVANKFYKHTPAAVANSAMITKNVLTSSTSEKKTYAST